MSWQPLQNGYSAADQAAALEWGRSVAEAARVETLALAARAQGRTVPEQLLDGVRQVRELAGRAAREGAAAYRSALEGAAWWLDETRRNVIDLYQRNSAWWIGPLADAWDALRATWRRGLEAMRTAGMVWIAGGAVLALVVLTGGIGALALGFTAGGQSFLAGAGVGAAKGGAALVKLVS